MASKSRPVYWPPADLPGRDIPVTELEPEGWVRLHPAGLDPIYFSRNDENRFSPATGPCGALYVGANPETCIWEKYGDIIFGYRQRGEPVILADADWRSRKLTELHLPKLKICDLTDAETLQACGVDTSALVSPDLALPQAWGVALMSHPASFESIRYLSRFTQAPYLAIFDHAPRIRRQRPIGLLAEHDAGMQVLRGQVIGLV